jgi:hypothetical protein
MNPQPLLSTVSAFVLVAIVIGLSTYLRQLSETRERLIDEIEAGKIGKFPSGAPQTAAKLAYLEASRSRLNRVAPILIWFSIIVIGRVAALAGFEIPNGGASDMVNYVFRWCDFILMMGVGILFFGLWYMHYNGRQQDDAIRAITKGWIAGNTMNSRPVD